MFQRDNGSNKFYYRPEPTNNHYLIPNPDIYGFAERREAEGSEDFDAVTHDNPHPRNDKVAYPQFSSSANQPSTTPGKNVRFEAFSAPTSPYNHHYHVQYKPTHKYGYRSTEEVREFFFIQFFSGVWAPTLSFGVVSHRSQFSMKYFFSFDEKFRPYLKSSKLLQGNETSTFSETNSCFMFGADLYPL